jgi:hypothetical protein
MLVGFVVVVWLLLGLRVDGHPLMKPGNFLVAACALMATIDPQLLGLEKGKGHAHRKRKTKYVNDIFSELGPHYSSMSVELIEWSHHPSGGFAGCCHPI